MEIQELRTKNCLRYFNDIVVVDGIHNTIQYRRYVSATRLKGNTTYFNEIDAFSPIPLTEEWLLKFGFTKGPESFFISHNDLTYHLESRADVGFKDGGYFMGIRYDDWEQDPVTIQKFTYDVKYVHQLQNLYFALTSQELTIKE
jgi:hypothetical protein